MQPEKIVSAYTPIEYFSAGYRLMKEEELKQIKARVEAATPGPWVLHTDSSRPDVCAGITDSAGNYSGPKSGFMGEGHLFEFDKYGPSWGQEYDNCADAEFVAHARQDVPALIAEVERLRAELNELANCCRALLPVFDTLHCAVYKLSLADEIAKARRVISMIDN